MVIKKPEGRRRAAPDKNTVSIRKPTLPATKKLERVLDFAQGSSSLTTRSSRDDGIDEGGVAKKIAPADDNTLSTSAWSRMPNTSEARAILRERARIISQREKPKDETGSQQYVRFKLGETALYGIPYRHIQEILPLTKVTRLPCTPVTVAGIINYRGVLLAVFNLREIFHIEKNESDHSDYVQIIVVGKGKESIGLIVDEIEDNADYVPADLESMQGGSVLVEGIYQGKVAMLNISALLTDPMLQIDESVN